MPILEIPAAGAPLAQGDILTGVKLYLTRRADSLNHEFVRDLHLRIFGAFANLGFDDHSWLPDDDLNWLVQMGESELKASQAAESAELAIQAKCQAEGKQFDDKKLKAARKT